MIYNMLFDWQKNIVNNYMSKKAFGLFLDMGLGKTPVSLAFAEQNECSKVIIITLNNKALEDETIKGSFLWWAKKSDFKYNFYNKKSKTCPTNKTNDILILNYESLYERKSCNKKSSVTIKSNIVEFIKSCEGHNVAIIVDESHKLKSTNSIQTMAVSKIKKAVKLVSKECYTYLLSGTPFTVGYIDLYSQLVFLGYKESKTSFTNKFCIRGNLPGLLGWQQPIIGYKNLDQLYNTVHQYAITIKSNEVFDLPDKIIIDHIEPISDEFSLITKETLEGYKIIKGINKLTGEQGKTMILNEFDKKSKVNNPFYRNIAYPSDEWLAETAGSFWMRCRQISVGFQGNEDNYKWYNKSRLNKLKELLRNNPDNYIIFYNYTPELFEIFNVCEELEYNIDVYCGGIKTENYYLKYSNQEENKKLTNKKNVIIANFASGSTGKNWQEYNKCIIFSVPLYKDWDQGLKRVHRYGQNNTVFYHIFYQDNWLDRDMIKSLKEKIQYSEDLFKEGLKNNSK